MTTRMSAWHRPLGVNSFTRCFTHLRHSVPDRRDAQRPRLPICLGDVSTQYHLRPVRSVAQRGAELFKEALDSALLDCDDRLLVDTRRALVLPHLLPRLLKDVTPPDVAVQRVEAPSPFPLCRSAESPSQSSHFVGRPTAAGVVRSARDGHSLALTCSDDVTTPGTLPSGRVVPHDPHRYYDPLGLPLHSRRFRH
jgi:hypothetical protein